MVVLSGQSRHKQDLGSPSVLEDLIIFGAAESGKAVARCVNAVESGCLGGLLVDGTDSE